VTIADGARVIGLTGAFGSGCTTAAKALRDDRGFRLVSLSQELRRRWNESSSDEPTRPDLQRLGDELRQERGAGVLVELALAEEAKEATPFDHIVVDSIRNLGEVERLRDEFGYRFILMAILASSEDRWVRIGTSEYIEKGRTQDEFVEDDQRDRNEETDHGQQVELTIDAADIIIDNSGEVPLPNFKAKVIEFTDLAVGTVNRHATKDELHMHMAFSSAHTSKCLKRNVGAVIVDSEGEVLGIGYNENPSSTHPCVEEPEYEYRCFRDIVRNNHFAQLTQQGARCPECGEPIPELVGPPWRCPSCLAGGKKTNLEAYFFPDRAMNWCTAIHAEERAILAAGHSARGASLYTTTFPCFLCAEKIINAGIGVICFTEAYADSLSEGRLDLAGVRHRQFEGVRSSAFERLFPRQKG
jgi:deoxycytidylate deaminase/dephospho-CoA kinase